MHPPTKGSLEFSHFLTSSMYLCHFLTTLDSMKPFASGSRILLLSTVSTIFSKRADSILILICHLMRDLGWHSGETPLFPDVVGPHNIRRQHFLMLRWVLLCDYCSFFLSVCRRPLNLVGPPMPTSPSLFTSLQPLPLVQSMFLCTELSSAFIIHYPRGRYSCLHQHFRHFFFKVTLHEHGACPPHLYTLIY
jgi:hypothetical protein